MSDATPVAPSATPDSTTETPLSAADQAVIAGDISAYRAARAAERAGKPLEPSTTPDAASGEPDDQAGERPDTAPASEPGKPAQDSGHKGNAETRIKALNWRAKQAEERAERLERELSEARKRTDPTPSKPTKPADAASAKAPGDDPEPQLDDYQNEADPYAAWMRACSRWEARQEHKRIDTEREQRAAAETAGKAEEERIKSFKGRINQAGGNAFLEGVSEEVRALKPAQAAKVAGEPVTARHVVASELIKSDVAPALMKHWTDHPEDLAKFDTCSDLPALLREFGRQEARVSAAPATPAKTVTSAPPPPTTLGSHPVESADRMEAAWRSGDMAAFKAERRRERAAAR
jgi:hypothetical protein